ncbi:hypothetical protein [Halopseudomonas maritima]|uniref:hypothetical protein n=1 Tax=Halopseudomonas maritima TaxID=2918528 RepID=UPI001EEB50A8|nr:hypothetical protein [Halopseudomonas maritima]UJJ30244.1 hypothetical protein HV822_10590 [Halopseudomonas maritima]
MTGHFKPFSDSHAIVEVVFFFEFAGRVVFPDDIEARVTDAVSAVEGREWRYEPVKSIKVNVAGHSTPGVSQSDDGFQMVSMRSDRPEPAWQISAYRSQITLHCLEYSRWALTSKMVQKYLDAVFSTLGEQNAKVRMFGMKVLDRFVYFGELAEFSASELFDESSEFLNKSMFRSGHRWHLHTGWFEKGACDDEELLSQLSIDAAAIAPPDHRPNVGVSIDHTLSVRAVPARDLGDRYTVWSGSLDKVFERFELMHMRNKEIVCSLLNRDVCDSMNMHIK